MAASPAKGRQRKQGAVDGEVLRSPGIYLITWCHTTWKLPRFENGTCGERIRPRSIGPTRSASGCQLPAGGYCRPHSEVTCTLLYGRWFCRRTLVPSPPSTAEAVQCGFVCVPLQFNPAAAYEFRADRKKKKSFKENLYNDNKS